MSPQSSHWPFPGMSPYLEDPALWPELHRHIVGVLAELSMAELVAGRYKATIRTRRYTTATAQAPEEHEEDRLEICQKSDDKLVTLLEVVSPANKTTPAGRQAYLEDRRVAQESGANLVEIDLVLQGEPTLTYSRDGLPKWDYAVTVTRSTQPERYEIYTTTLQKRLPRFRMPFASNDRDTVLDLQVAFARCSAEGGYVGRIDYRREPTAPLTEEDRRWLDALLTDHKLREPPPPHDEIAPVAYRIWEQEGRPHGRDKEHWHLALAQLRQQKEAMPKSS